MNQKFSVYIILYRCDFNKELKKYSKYSILSEIYGSLNIEIKIGGDFMKVSEAYEIFQKEAPEVSKAWHDFVMEQGNVSKLDKKTHSLAYLSVLSAVGLHSGIPFHVKMAKVNGASRDEVISAILVGIPAVGNIVTSSVVIAVQAYDE